ncbi:MAG: gliding motility lipoprotein GldH, partial [Prevotella sp.]|nr:gliding motility lipoprotein GldH [Prevotella sp.]
NGISYYQYNFNISHIELHKGDSIHVCIRHNMKREILPGISDVGFSLGR